MRDPSSEMEAKRIIESLLEDARVRKKCLSMFADSIAEANVYGNDRWVITCDSRNEVRLHVGHVIICSLEKHGIWMALDEEFLESEQSLEFPPSYWRWYKEYLEYRSINSRNGYYNPQGMSSEEHQRAWERIRPLHFESISKAAKKWKKGVYDATRRRHASGVLKYLQRELERELPDPHQ